MEQRSPKNSFNRPNLVSMMRFVQPPSRHRWWDY
jgi:hypothetical protein